MFPSRTRKAQAGFTMIELMVVVAIVGVLAAFAVPQYQEYSSRTQMTRAVAEISAYKTSVETLLIEGKTTIYAKELGYVQSNLTNAINAGGLWTYTKASNTGYLEVIIGGNASTAINGTRIRLTRDAMGTWSCTIAAPSDRSGWRKSYVPPGCSETSAPAASP